MEIHTDKKDLGKLRSEAQEPYSHKTDILRRVKGNTVSFCVCSISTSLSQASLLCSVSMFPQSNSKSLQYQYAKSTVWAILERLLSPKMEIRLCILATLLYSLKKLNQIVLFLTLYDNRVCQVNIGCLGFLHMLIYQVWTEIQELCDYSWQNICVFRMRSIHFLL